MASLFSRFTKKSTQNIYVSIVNPSLESFATTFGSTGTLTTAQLIQNSTTIPQIFAITEYVTSKIAGIPIKVVKQSGRDAPNSYLQSIIEQPNHYQSFQELVKLSMAYYELTGNSYIYGIVPDGMGIKSELYCLPPDKTYVMLARESTLPAWMNEVKGYQVNIGGMYYFLPADAVLHERYLPLSYDSGMWIYGLSKYVPGDKIAKELKAIHDAKTSIIEHRGAMGFISNQSEVPDAEQSKIVQERLAEDYGLRADQKKVIVTTERLSWNQMSLGIAELQLIENKKASFDDLCWLNGMDPVIFSTEGSTFSNKKEAEKKYILQVIKPRVDNFYKQLSIFLNNSKTGDQIVADWSKVEEVQADRKEMTAVLCQQIDYSIITPHEAAEILYGEDEENKAPDLYFRKTSLTIAETEMPEQPEQTINGASGSLSQEEEGPLTADMVRQLIEENTSSNGN